MSAYSNRLQPALQNLLQCVVRFFHLRSSCTTTHISADVQRITLNASCMTISGGRTKQLDIFCCVTGFTSDFLRFIVVELIRFFHGAIKFYNKDKGLTTRLRTAVIPLPSKYCNHSATRDILPHFNVISDSCKQDFLIEVLRNVPL